MDPTKQTPRFDTTTVSSAPHALDIDALVRNLERLAAVPQTMSRLVSTGKPAVRALRRLLLGPPDADPTPCVLAVTSLGRIHSQRAIRALIAAL